MVKRLEGPLLGQNRLEGRTLSHPLWYNRAVLADAATAARGPSWEILAVHEPEGLDFGCGVVVQGMDGLLSAEISSPAGGAP